MKKMIKKIAAAFMAFALVAAGMLAVNKAEVKAATTYYVAGQAGLCGVDWDPAAAVNVMTDNGDGTYTKVYHDVAIGTYKFKVTDGTWTNAWGDNGQDYQIQVGSVCDITITFNSSTGKVNATGSGLVVPTLEVEKSRLEEGVLVGDLFVESGLVSSKSEVRRLCAQGGILVGDTKITDFNHKVTLDDLTDGYVLLKKGKKNFVKLMVK